MPVTLEEFKRKKDFLICVDSDGCAMDTMDIKHIRSFGPCMVAEWRLDKWAEPILDRWNEINLYSMTRGINRFKGLSMALTEIDAKYTSIEGLGDLQAWVVSGAAPSNDAIQKAIDENGSAILKKALSWSKAVNASISQLPEEEIRPFPGVKKGLAAAIEFADVVMVSSANYDAVMEEWTKHGLIDYVDVVMAQNMGSKAHCIKVMLGLGYEKDHVLMIGDAPGDQDAAEQNGVYYYPILVRHEKESWDELVTNGFERFKTLEYAPYGAERKQAFLRNLGAE